jgi:hypothetical protein
MTVRLSALHAGRPLPAGRLLVLISVKRLSRPPGHSAAGRIWSIEQPNDLTENPTQDRTVPQPTTLQRAPHINKCICINNHYIVKEG